MEYKLINDIFRNKDMEYHYMNMNSKSPFYWNDFYFSRLGDLMTHYNTFVCCLDDILTYTRGDLVFPNCKSTLNK